MATGGLSILAVDVENTPAYRTAVAETIDGLARDVEKNSRTLHNGLADRVDRIDRRVWWILVAVVLTSVGELVLLAAK